MKKKVCIIGTLKFGIGHYIAHIYPELSQEYDLNVLTFTHGSPPGSRNIVLLLHPIHPDDTSYDDYASN